MLDLTVDASPRACARCRTQLPVHALACPACSALVHREQLQQLAELAAAATAAGDRTVARAHWQSARDLVPADSEQQQLIAARMAALTDAEVRLPGPASAGDAPRAWWTRILAAIATVSLLFVGKLKFLLLGLSKISTLASMFSFIAVYWSIHGWPLAVGLAGSIYIHEMGHVAMLRRLGIKSGAPLFIPGVGALVMLREHITDPVVDARVGLAGPVWGLGAAVTAWLVYLLTGGAYLAGDRRAHRVPQPVQPDARLAARWRARLSCALARTTRHRDRHNRRRAVAHQRRPVVDRWRSSRLPGAARQAWTRPPADSPDLRWTRARPCVVCASDRLSSTSPPVSALNGSRTPTACDRARHAQQTVLHQRVGGPVTARTSSQRIA